MAKQEDGPFEEYRFNGQLYKKGAYKDGRWDGPFEKYYPNGQLEMKVTFKDGEQVRSEEYPDGDHGWMDRGERFVDCYSPTCVSAGEYPTGELIEEAYGKRTTTRTCWFCRFPTEPKDEWGQVWVVAA